MAQKASESAFAPVQALLAAKMTAEANNDAAATAAIVQQLSDLGYT